MSFSSHMKGSDFHLGESQWVVGALPPIPRHTVEWRSVFAYPVETV